MTAINNNLKAILFDMDGVLVDSMSYHMQSWMQLLEKYRIIITEQFIYEHEGAMGLDIIQNLFDKTGISLDVDQIAEIYEQQNRIFREEYLEPGYALSRDPAADRWIPPARAPIWAW